MANDDPREELVSSVASLFDNPKFSDLLISTTKKIFRAHKAIVCLRSPFFAEECNVPEPEATPRLNLEDDDPEAVGRVLEFLYKLDYSTSHTQASETNGSTVPSEGPAEAVNGNGAHTANDGVSFAHEPDVEHPVSPKVQEFAGDSLDDFLPRQKKGKKKKRAKSIAPAPEPGLIEDAALAAEEAQALLNGGAREFVPGDKENGQAAAGPPVAEYIPSNPITAHSRVYTLSAKYEIPSLKALSLGRFEKRANALWNTDDFVQAAKEVYSTSSVGSERDMKDVITRVISQNPAILDKAELKEVIRGGELGLDLVLHLKTQGGFKSDTDDAWGY